MVLFGARGSVSILQRLCKARNWFLGHIPSYAFYALVFKGCFAALLVVSFKRIKKIRDTKSIQKKRDEPRKCSMVVFLQKPTKGKKKYAKLLFLQKPTYRILPMRSQASHTSREALRISSLYLFFWLHEQLAQLSCAREVFLLSIFCSVSLFCGIPSYARFF
jgi:hypothetical protein